MSRDPGAPTAPDADFSAENDPATTLLAVNAGASELLVKGSAVGS